MKTAEALEWHPGLVRLEDMSEGALEIYTLSYDNPVPYMQLCAAVYNDEVIGIWLVYDGAHKKREMRRSLRHKTLLMHKMLKGHKYEKKDKWQDERTEKTFFPLAARDVPAGKDAYVMSLIDIEALRAVKRDKAAVLSKWWWMR